jgi:hypothetical protein
MKHLFILIFLFQYMVLFGQENTKFPKLRFNLMGGPSYLVASSKDAEGVLINDYGFSPSTAKDYYKGLKWAWQGNADIHYMIRSEWGLGLKYAYFKTKQGKKEYCLIPQTTGYDYVYTNIKESMYVHYIGPSFYVQRFIDKKHHWKVASLLSVGYAGYKDKGRIVQVYIRPFSELSFWELSSRAETSISEHNILLRGSTVGTYISCGMEYLIHKNIGIGFDLSSITAIYKKLKRGNQIIDLGDKPENVSRLDASLGIRIYL